MREQKPPPTHRELLEHLASRGVLEDWQIHPSLPTGCLGKNEADQVSLTGHLSLQGHRIHLRITLPWTFPLCLPVITLERIDPSLRFPHLIGKNQLCYEAGANLLDRHDPQAIAYEALLRARAMIGELIAGNRAEEFAQEVVAYWSRIAKHSVVCLVDPSEHPHVTMALYMPPLGLCAVADQPRVLRERLLNSGSEDLPLERALYIPLDPASVDPGFVPEELKTLPGLRKYVRALPEKDRLELKHLLARRSGPDSFVVLGVRRPRGQRALIGIHLRQLRGGHPLANERADAQVIPVDLLRYDPSFLAPRGGASASLQARRVLLTGCGALGGHIALALARAGVGKLSLVDHDLFEVANTYRHVCGVQWAGVPKVLGLKQYLENLIPFIEVTPHAEPLEVFLKQGPGRLREYDVVISALGNPTIELHLNEQLWSDPSLPPALFAWVEPHSLGGHVLLTHVRGPQGLVRGCFECLHQRPNEGGPLENRAAFASPGVTYTQDMLGCGSQHLPFADLDAQRTAEMAVRLSLRVLNSEATEAPLLSWKGEKRAFEEAGYTVTPRYLADPGQLEAQRLFYKRDDCLVCRE